MIHQNKDKSPMRKSELEILEIELSDAKKAVHELASQIEEANMRSKGLHRQPKWRQEEDFEASVKTEDARYTEVMKELEHMKQELVKLKLDMARVLKEKRHAERATKASSSKTSNLMASMELMKKELQELDEKQALVEFARNETNELQITVCDVNLVKQEGSPLNNITNELDGAKRELESVKGEGFKFMTSMDVIRDELKHVRDETARLQKAEQKRELTVQSLNSKILRAKSKLESLTSAESRTSAVASNLIVTLEQLRGDAETTKKVKETIDEEIENMNVEICKTELEIDVAEERLEIAMEELKAIKASESKALGNLRKLINTTAKARDTASMNGSMITITNFEYEYLTGKAGVAADLADKKIAAAQAWVEALKASERELLMKIETTQNVIGELSIEVDPDADADGEAPGPGPRAGPRLHGKVVDSPRRSMTKVGNKVFIKRVRSQKFRAPAARYSGKSGSFPREKMTPKVSKLVGKKNVATDEGVI